MNRILGGTQEYLAEIERNKIDITLAAHSENFSVTYLTALSRWEPTVDTQ